MDNEGNPYQSPEIPPLVDASAKSQNRLGSLSQSARAKQLKSARTIFIVIGVLTIAANAFMWTRLRDDIRKELLQEVENERRQAAAQGMELDQAAVTAYLEEAEEEAMKMGNLIFMGTIGLGIVFILLGIFVNSAPVPITIAGLVLYLLAAVGFAVLDPTTLAQGLIIKVFIVVGMVKAVKSAFAYEREKEMEERRRFAV